jgi:AcrR family transcriptional regulator
VPRSAVKPSTKRRTQRSTPNAAANGAHLLHGPLPRRLRPRRQPVQPRARATVDAILIAAADLVARDGPGAASTNRIAARAGVSIGSLYQYFPTSESILLALFERHIAEIAPIIASGIAAVRNPAVALEDAIGGMLRALLARHDARPTMARAMDVFAAGALPDVSAFRDREEHFRRDLAAALAGRADVRAGDHSLIASLLFELVEAASRWVIHGDGLRFDRHAALEEAVASLCAAVRAC